MNPLATLGPALRHPLLFAAFLCFPVPRAVCETTGSTGPAGQEPSVESIFPDILHQQKSIWQFPIKVAQGRHLKPVFAVTAAAAALVALDPYDEPYFKNNLGFQSYKTGPIRGRNTTVAILLVPAATYLGGLAGRDSYAKSTGLLAAEGIADTQIASLVLKAVSGRLHPSEIPPHGDFTHTWFKYAGPVHNPGSFPSGHAMSAFAVAAVFSARYHDHRWVPWVAYSAAAAIALTRIPDQAHFPSDVFMGAALGYAISHFIVLRR